MLRCQIRRMAKASQEDKPINPGVLKIRDNIGSMIMLAAPVWSQEMFYSSLAERSFFLSCMGVMPVCDLTYLPKKAALLKPAIAAICFILSSV